MKKNTKVAVGLFLTIGVVGVALYFIRQAKLLRNICVRAASVDWTASVVEVAQLYNQGQSLQSISLPLDLELSNRSDTDVTITKVDLDLYAEQDLIGVIATDFEQILAKNSIAELSVDFQFVENAPLGTLAAAYGLGAITGDPLDFTIVGKITAEASVFESIEVKYRSTFSLGELSSGNALNEDAGSNCE
tara:strand:- start:167 stop:736 length:570 start_codon:yes stop_codon:yes gene_type:complete